MIPDELARRLLVRDLAMHDNAHVLVDFLIEQPGPEQLLELVRAITAIKIEGIGFTGVFTMLPAPTEGDRAQL